MVEERKATAGRLPLKVLGVFVAALVLQGASLAVLEGERPALTKARSPQPPVLSNPVFAPEIYTVTSTADDGDGSLRQAILDANTNPGRDQIRFDFNNQISITLLSPLVITDPVDIEAAGPWITDTYPSFVTLDGSNLAGNMMVITQTLGTGGTSIRRLRLVNVNDGYGFLVSGPDGVEIISNTILNSSGGVGLLGTKHFTATGNVFMGIRDAAFDAKDSDDLLIQENLIRTGSAAIRLLDGVENSLVFSNTTVGVFGEFAPSAFFVAGDPAPTDIVMRGNTFTDTNSPIFLGPGANNGFPTPEVLTAFEPFTLTKTLQFSVRSSADPISFTYPLLMDVYRVRDGNYFPLGATGMYDQIHVGEVVTMTVSLQPTQLKAGDFLSVVATTFGSSSSEFAIPVPLAPPPDEDGDGIADGSDICPDTEVPEENVPSFELGVNRFALIDGDDVFDTLSPVGRGPGRAYALAETGGCSCEQIIDALGLGAGHRRLGCSISAMDEWLAELDVASKGNVERTESAPESYVIEPNYPNPFNPNTTISFKVPEQGHVAVRVFDMLGREVKTLLSQDLDPGTYRVQWDGRNAQGQPVSSGVYIYRLAAGDFVSAKTMILHR